MRWAAITWPDAEPWYWRRGQAISIAAAGHSSKAGALAAAARLDAAVRAPRALPVHVLVVGVDDAGNLADGPIRPDLRQANPAANRWLMRQSGGRYELERADLWAEPPAGWSEYRGTRPPGPRVEVSAELAAAGKTSIAKGRVVTCADSGLVVPEAEHACTRGECWSRLARLQGVMRDLGAGPLKPLPHLTQGERAEHLARLRSRIPPADPWVSVCLLS